MLEQIVKQNNFVMPSVKHLNDQLYNVRNYQGDRVGFKS